MPSGLEDLPSQVDDSLRSYGSDTFAMGQEFLWLSGELPPVAQGNYTPYKATSTTTRMMMAQALPMYQMPKWSLVPVKR